MQPHHMARVMQMEQNSEPVDTPLTSMSQNPAQNVESTLPSQTTEDPSDPPYSASDGTDSGPSQNQASPINPHVGAYTAQCSLCFKPRMIPTEEKFEEICDRNKEQHFVCADVREWRPEVSCNTDADLPEDGSFKFAIEKQHIARLPSGWKRLVKIRSTGAKFADVYYISPSGRRLRSKADVERYLSKHRKEAKRVSLSQFSFQPPKPADRLKQRGDD